MTPIALRYLLASTLVLAMPVSATPGWERELRDTEATVCRAFEVGDAVILKRALTPDFTLTGSTGAVQNLAQTLGKVERREPRYEEFRNSDQAMRRYGDAAVVTGITHIRGTSAGQAFAADFAFTDTWVRRGGHWVLAASHASKRPAASP